MSFQDIGPSTVGKRSLNSLKSFFNKQSNEIWNYLPATSQSQPSAIPIIFETAENKNKSNNNNNKNSINNNHNNIRQRNRLNLSNELNNSNQSIDHSSTDGSELHNNNIKRNSKNKKSIQQKSEFSNLMNETQQFQKIVSDLESIMLLNNNTTTNNNNNSNNSKKTNNKDGVGECPETTWKARILIRSAEETEKDLYEKLVLYERSILIQKNKLNIFENKQNFTSQSKQQLQLLMAQQTGCTKLKRDFGRSRKVLNMCLLMYDQRQQIEIKQLQAIDWSSNPTNNTQAVQNNNDDHEIDFFDQAMRQRDIERINAGMETVNIIYKELANIVDVQQETINQLENETEYASANVNAAAQNIHCLHERQAMNPLNSCNIVTNDTDDDEYIHNTTTCGATISLLEHKFNCTDASNPIKRFDSKISFSDESIHHQQQQQQQKYKQFKYKNTKYNNQSILEVDEENDNDNNDYNLRTNETINWFMPFETFGEDISSVKEDILTLGKVVVSKAGKQLNCGSSPTY